MRWIAFFIPLAALLPQPAAAFGALVCSKDGNTWQCGITYDQPSPDAAVEQAISLCSRSSGNCGRPWQFSNECFAAAAGPNTSIMWADHFPTQAATSKILDECNRKDGNCRLIASACDVVPSPAPTLLVQFNLVPTSISSVILVILILLIYASRKPIINFVIHGNLPYKLPVYGEDIQCLFKRTQRVNWYGRVVFGVVANLSMTHDQLTDVRKYWLGRVIAFDSLRRQRQNQLARMHIQLAAAAVPETKGKTALRQIWTALKYIFFVIFYLVRALFSFLFSFLFIRITIARLVRGTIVESTDLVLILQAKDAIEASANYLKEYLVVANTFDERDEVYEPE